MSRPNILLVMADQLTPAVLGATGAPLARTPAIDALAGDGTVFANAYCPSPLCAPSRASLLTGTPPSQHGVFDNGAELPAATPTITHVLREAGYRTTLAGKMHFVGPDQLHGFEERLTTDVYPADLDWTPDWSLPDGERLPWYHNMHSLRMAGVVDGSLQADFDDEVSFRAERHLRDLARGGDGRPFFLTVSFTAPHDPWEVRRAAWDRYQSVDIGRPAVGPIDRSQADPFSLRLRDMYLADAEPLSPEQAATARRAYLASVSEVDDRVGSLLSVLEANGLADDTLVLFTADHGEMLGERGLWYKMALFDGSSRVPLVVCGPGVRRGRVEAPVSLLDLAPTLAALAGAEGRLEFPGHSLLAACSEGAQPQHDVAAEYLAEGVTAPALMLRRGTLKYIACGDDPEQLYDLAADPHELRNLAGDPAHERALVDLRHAAGERWDARDLAARVRDSQSRRLLVSAALGRGAHTPWDHQPPSDASREYVRGDAAANPRPEQLRPLGGLPD